VSERGITLGFDIFCQADQRNVKALKERLGSAEQDAPADGGRDTGFSEFHGARRGRRC